MHTHTEKGGGGRERGRGGEGERGREGERETGRERERERENESRKQDIDIEVSQNSNRAEYRQGNLQRSTEQHRNIREGKSLSRKINVIHFGSMLFLFTSDRHPFSQIISEAEPGLLPHMNTYL